MKHANKEPNAIHPNEPCGAALSRVKFLGPVWDCGGDYGQ